MTMFWMASVLGCSPSFSPNPQIRFGEPDTGAAPAPDTDTDAEDSAAEDSAAEDSAAEDSGMPGEDTGWPAPVDSGEVCYLGPDRDDTACLPTVLLDVAWSPSYAYPEPLQGNPQYQGPSNLIDLTAVDAELSVAPNFTLDELMQERKGRYGMFQRHTVATLQQLRTNTGGPIRVTSGYRNVTYNAGVGGATYSRHMYGDAADLQSDTVSLEALAEACEALGAAFTSVYTSHVHCDWRDTPLDETFFDVETARRARTPKPVVNVTTMKVGAVWRAEAEGFDEGEPLRRWTAFTADGLIVESVVVAEYTPPVNAARVEVEVGGLIVRSVRLQ